MVALILAAGYATRLYPYTLNTPKPLLPVCGRPLIDYIMDAVSSVPNLDKTIVVTNNKFYAQFEKWRENQNNPRIEIVNDGTNSVEKRLGAIGDIGFALSSKDVDDEILVIAGDNLFTYDLKEQYDCFKNNGGDCICVKELYNSEALKSLGVCELDENSKVIGFTEKPEQPKTNLAVYATYIFRKDSLRFVNEFLKDDQRKDAPGYFIEWLYRKTDVYAYFINGECYDIGTVEAYERLRNDFIAM